MPHIDHLPDDNRCPFCAPEVGGVQDAPTCDCGGVCPVRFLQEHRDRGEAETGHAKEAEKIMQKMLAALLGIVLVVSTAWARTLVIALDATWPPMEFVDGEKHIVGFDPDYMRAAAREAGYQVEFKNVAWDGIFGGLAAGKFDAVCSSVTITAERQQAMDFSIPYFQVRQALVVPQSTSAVGLEDMQGKTLGAQIGTTGYFALKQARGVQAKSYDEIGLAMEDLFNGRIDGVVADDPVAAQYALKRADYAAKLKIAAVLNTGRESYGVAVKKGNHAVVELLNQGIQAVQEKGIDQQLQAKWLGQ
jgi:polar amino acid transport system substrate-binding protein